MKKQIFNIGKFFVEKKHEKRQYLLNKLNNTEDEFMKLVKHERGIEIYNLKKEYYNLSSRKKKKFNGIDDYVNKRLEQK